MEPRILIVEDEEAYIQDYATWYREAGFGTALARSRDEALSVIESEDAFPVAHVDLMIPSRSESHDADPRKGIEVVSSLRRRSALTEIVVVTMFGDIQQFGEFFDEVMRHNVFSWIDKRLLIKFGRHLERQDLTARVSQAWRFYRQRQAAGYIPNLVKELKQAVGKAWEQQPDHEGLLSLHRLVIDLEKAATMLKDTFEEPRNR